MKPTRLLPALLALFAGVSLATAQKEAAPKQEVKPVPAAVAMPKVKFDLTLPVLGLSAENATKAKTALEAVQHEFFTCAECKAQFPKTGDCPKCKKPLTASKAAVLAMVTTDPTKGLITLQTKEGMELKLSALERALQADAIKIDDGKFTLPGSATLFVNGATTAEQATSIQAALIEAKLFQTVHAQATPVGVRIHVIAGATAPTLVRTREVLTKANAAFKLTDVSWNGWIPPAAG